MRNGGWLVVTASGKVGDGDDRALEGGRKARARCEARRCIPARVALSDVANFDGAEAAGVCDDD